MAERGVTIEMRGPDGRILPGGGSRARRIRDAARARWASAGTDLERLAVADDYASAAATAAGRGGLDASAELDRAIRVLWATGESLTRQLADRERGDD